MNWIGYALLSAFFGALVAIFGKIGVRDVDSNLAVAFRTAIIVFFAWGIVFVQGNAADLFRISRHSAWHSSSLVRSRPSGMSFAQF